MEQAIQQIIDSPWFFRALALVVLAFFYGIYFAKQIAQKKRGIQTRQIGRRKEKGLRTVELLMAAATLSVVVAELVSVALDWNYMPSGARFTGFCLGMCGDVLFLISVLFMKDSWRAGVSKTDQTELVTDGIYQISRNPAFLGFDLVYVGILNRDTLSFILNQKVVVRSLKQMIERQPRFLDTHCNSFTMSVSFRVIMFWKCRLGEIIEIEKRYGK